MKYQKNRKKKKTNKTSNPFGGMGGMGGMEGMDYGGPPPDMPSLSQRQPRFAESSIIRRQPVSLYTAEDLETPASLDEMRFRSGSQGEGGLSQGFGLDSDSAFDPYSPETERSDLDLPPVGADLVTEGENLNVASPYSSPQSYSLPQDDSYLEQQPFDSVDRVVAQASSFSQQQIHEPSLPRLPPPPVTIPDAGI